MGYRTYIGELSKEKYNEIKEMTLKELYDYTNGKYKDEDDDYLYISGRELVKELYCFGKYTPFEDEKFFSKVFEKEETNERMLSEQDFWLVQKEYLRHIIEWYKAEIKVYYQDMLKVFETESEFKNSISTELDNSYKYETKADFSKLTEAEQQAIMKMFIHVRSINNEWNFMNLCPFDLNKGDEVSTSWRYEYAIFELVRIYKTFDWDNNLMIYYGW